MDALRHVHGLLNRGEIANMPISERCRQALRSRSISIRNWWKLLVYVAPRLQGCKIRVQWPRLAFSVLCPTPQLPLYKMYISMMDSFSFKGHLCQMTSLLWFVSEVLPVAEQLSSCASLWIHFLYIIGRAIPDEPAGLVLGQQPLNSGLYCSWCDIIS